MKTFLKPVVKASERFFVTADGEGAARRAEFLLGVAVAGGVEQVLQVRRAGEGGALGAVGAAVQRELRRGADVFVVHGVVDGNAVTVWSVEVHVTPARVALFEGSVARSPSKFAARVQVMAERAWGIAARREDLLGEVAGAAAVAVPEVPVGVTVDARALSADEELMLMMSDSWDGRWEAGAGVA